MNDTPQSSKSPFLVHWTGKDIDSRMDGDEAEKLSVCNDYVERLINTLSTGLWMMPPPESLMGSNAWFYYKPPMTCFTETLLTRARDHATRYGRMGFGFTREFILTCGGAPVTYVRQHPKDPVLQRINGIFRRLDGAQSFIEPIEEIGVFRALRELDEMRDLLEQICAFIKPMSDYGTDNFIYLEEAEWRVAFNKQWYRTIQSPLNESITFGVPRAIDEFREKWEKPPNIVESNIDIQEFYLSFKPDDLALLVMPDNDARKMAWGKKKFKKWIAKRNLPLPILVLQECVSF